MHKISAIHQPNFCPWLGFFIKIAKSDEFILFDSVALPQGKSWCYRVKITQNNKEKWLSVPIIKAGKSGQMLCEAEIQEPQKSFKSIMGVLRGVYLKAPFFREIWPVLTQIFERDYTYLADLNTAFIEEVASLIIEKKITFHRSSKATQLVESDNTKTEYIVETCNYYNVNNYISGTFCLNFLDLDQFKSNDIAISFPDFTAFPYSQFNTEEFIPGLSIIDVLMNLGIEGTKKHILKEID